MLLDIYKLGKSDLTQNFQNLINIAYIIVYNQSFI